MRAVALDADGLPELVELPDPSRPGALVHVLGCGLCGSDVEKLGQGEPGTVLGHEVVGTLDDGTRVTVMHRVPCGRCDRCRAGHESTCVEFAALRIDPGGFAERLTATHWLPLPDDVTGLAGVWVEPLACVLRAADAVPRGRVLVVGCGSVGQLWVQVLRGRGDEVVAADPRADRLARARMLGAVDDDGRFASAAVVTAQAGAGDALRRLEPGATLLVFAAPPGEIPIPLDAVYRGELHVVGSRSATPRHFHAAVDLLPELDLPQATVLPLPEFRAGVELYRSGEATKVVFTP